MEYIELEDNNGNKIEVEVVSIFKLDGYSDNNHDNSYYGNSMRF